MNRARQRPTLVDILEQRIEALPERPAYIFLADGEAEGERLTYGELGARVHAVAAHLAASLAAGDRVLLLFPPGLDFIVGFLGCLTAGMVAVPAYPPASRRHLPRLRAIAADARPAAALTHSASLGKIRAAASTLPELAAIRWLTTDGADREAGAWQRPALDEDALAFLQYTSGSTAAPKGVMVSHRNLVHNQGLIEQAFRRTAEDVVVGWLPVYHDMGLIGNVLHPLYLGARCVLMAPVAFLQKPLRWLQAIASHGGTCSGGPSFAYDLCVRKVDPQAAASLDLSTWQVAFSGAEPVRADTLDRFAAAFAASGFHRRAFYPCYGMAEATLMVSGGDPTREPVVLTAQTEALEQDRVVRAAEAESGRRLVGCGRSWGQLLAIVDPETRILCPREHIGEIWVAGKSVAEGYWQRPEATAESFRAQLAADAVAGHSGPFLRTGDLGFLQGDELFITGRRKDLIIIRGRNHYPQDIELTVEASHPALREGCGAAVAVEVEGEERLVVIYEVERHARDTPEVIADAVRRAVAEVHALAVYDVVLIRVGTVPKTSSGKIQRHACRAGYEAGALTVVGQSTAAMAEADELVGNEIEVSREALLARDEAARHSLLEAYLRACAGRLIRRPAAALDLGRPLTALGLDSLTAAELKNEVESTLDVRLDLALLLEGASLEALAAIVLAQLARPPAAAAVPLEASAETSGAQPLSFGQRAMWFLHRLAPDAAAYNIAAAARVQGVLDTKAFEDALQGLVARHPALRTTFAVEAGEPSATMHDRLPCSFAVEDGTTLDAAGRDRRLADLAHQPFDLEVGPLLRATVLQLAPEEGEPQWAFLLVVHHIVSDFWSLAVMMRELGARYGEATGGAPALLEPLPFTYGDYARWQRAMLASAAGEALWDFWRQHLEAPLPQLDLPLDRPRPPVQTFNGAAQTRLFASALGPRLEALVAAQGGTAFMVLLAAYQMLLHRYSGQDDILVGAPATVRGDAALAEMVGYFVNPVVLRGDLAGQPSFSEFLDRVRRQALAAFVHRDFPFPLLVERLAPEHDPSRSPLFQAMFVWQQDRLPEEAGLAGFSLAASTATWQLGALPLTPIALEHRSAQFDLSLSMAAVDGQLMAVLDYNTDLFDATTTERLLAHLERLLGAALEAPGTAVGDLPLLAASELRQLLVGWNPPSSSGVAACLHELVAVQAAATPAAEALVVGEERITYRQLDRATNRLAHHLRTLGVEAEVPVGVCAGRGTRLVIALLAVLKAGGAYVPLDPAYPQRRIAFTLADSGLSVLLVDETAPEMADGGDNVQIVDLAGFGPVDVEDDPAAVAPPAGTVVPDNLAYLIYTSGSTGRPKGVAITHRSAATMVRWAHEVFAHADLAGCLAATSVCFDLSVFELFVPLTCGGRVILADNALALPTLPAADAVTLINTVPSAMAELLDGATLPAALTTVNLAGEPLPGALVARLHEASPTVRVFNLYGPSEDTTYSTYTEVPRDDPRPPTIGGPVHATQAYLVDRRQMPVPVGVPGELLLGGAGLARGYHGRPALTATRFVPDPFGSQPGARLYRTGDLARYRTGGALLFLGRLDHQVKVRGFRIELGEIETALLAHPAVHEAVVVAREEADGTLLVAYAALEEASEVDAPALRQALAERLPAFMAPQAFVLLPALPRTPNGKVDRQALPAPERGAGSDVEFVAPETEVEEVLAAIWCEVLSIEKVGIYDSFFDLGGHSLSATRVLSRVRDDFGVDLSVRALLEAPTIAGLTEAIAAKLMEDLDDDEVAAVMAELE